MELKTVLQHKAINEWNLFWLICLPISIAMIIGILSADLSNGAAVSSMIQYSVRCSVPWLYLAFTASSIHVLFPGLLSRWLLRNRKIFGLGFAAGMAWQLLFILWMITQYSDYYVEEVYVLRDLIEGIVGYLFLIAMTLTSFKFGRSRLKGKQWKYLHKSGIYFLWAYVWSVYWYELFYYQEPDWIDYVYYCAGFLAWGLRVTAWISKATPKTTASTALAFPLAGSAVITIGLIGAVTGSLWSTPAHDLLQDNSALQFFELYVPYYPFVPFLPAFVIMLGAFLVVRSRQQA